MEGFEDLFEEDLGLETPINDPKEDIFAGEDPTLSLFEEPTPAPTQSLIDDLLKARGIVDNKIKIVNEDNTESEISFFDLSKEEQLDILTDNQVEAPASDLQEDEQTLIQYLRDNNITLQQYLELYKEDVLQNGSGAEQVYDIDSYDDEELFLLDLKNRYDDLTDEELVKELEKELQDKDLFTKKVTKLRAEYKQLEEAYKEEQQREFNAQRETQYNQFVDTMVDVAVKTPDLYGIELEDDEKNNVLSFLLELDEEGQSGFYKSLNTPENLYRAAWFLTYGEQAFDALKNAYEAEIAKLKKDIPKVVVREPRKPNSINDLF